MDAGEIDVRLDGEKLQNLIEHLAVLAGDHVDAVDTRIRLQRLDDGGPS